MDEVKNACLHPRNRAISAQKDQFEMGLWGLSVSSGAFKIRRGFSSHFVWVAHLPLVWKIFKSVQRL
jgi:hypothetical protein